MKNEIIANVKENKIITHDVYNNEYQVDAENLNISVHLYGIAIKNDKILISPQYDGFDFPGGTAKKGETHINTLIREVKEETGYLVEPTQIINVYTSFFHHKKSNKDYQSYLIYYFVKIIDGDITDDGFDEDEKEYAQKAKWVDIEYLKNNRHACSINIIDELIDSIQSEMKSK